LPIRWDDRGVLATVTAALEALPPDRWVAAHSEKRLGVYTHVELHDCSAAIESLPAPPSECVNFTGGRQSVA
jgi:hypothetical protein